MTTSFDTDADAGLDPAAEVVLPEGVATGILKVKVGRILDEDDGSFVLEYDDTRGGKHAMRLDALTYEGALREARAFLEIQPDGFDADGHSWDLE